MPVIDSELKLHKHQYIAVELQMCATVLRACLETTLPLAWYLAS